MASARADMSTLVREILVGGRKKKDEVGYARWQVITAVKRGRELRGKATASNEGAAVNQLVWRVFFDFRPLD